MKILDVIHAIQSQRSIPDKKTVDGIIFGDPDVKLTGIVTTCTPTVEVIRKAVEIGFNLIISHEPTFYNHFDDTKYLVRDPVYEKKCELLSNGGITIYRDHDGIHAAHPDGIYHGIMSELCWNEFLFDNSDRPCFYELPQLPLSHLVAFFKKKLDLQLVRVIGNTHISVSKIAYIGGGDPGMDKKCTKLFMSSDIDVMIVGETVDWTVLSYINDAAQLGLKKAIIQLGHFNSESLGMKYYAEWLKMIISDCPPTRYIHFKDMYQYL